MLCPGSTADDPTLSAYYRESWFTCEGARLKARRLKARGLPNLKDWRFFTLTVDDRSAAPVTVYLRGKDRLRRFTAHWRETLGRDVRWLWKLELHEDGYPHWHMLLDYCEKIPADFFELVSSWWGLGRVNCRRVRASSMHYVFKYVCKGGQSIPDWILDYKGTIRCVQASSGFFTVEQKRSECKEPSFSKLAVSLRTLLTWDLRRGLLKETTPSGRRQVSVVRLKETFAAMHQSTVRFAIRCGTVLPSSTAITLGQYSLAELKRNHGQCKGLGLLPRQTADADSELAIGGRPHFARYGSLTAGRAEDVGG